MQTPIAQPTQPPIAEPRTIPQVPGATVTPQAPAVPIEVLQVQAAGLTRQLAGLEVQRKFLDRQLNDAQGESARSQLYANRANLDVQIAQAEADLDNVRAQIAARNNVPLSRVAENGQVIIQPPRLPRSAVDPDMVIGLSFTLLMAIALPLSIGYARRLWRGKPQPLAPKADEIAPRLDRLEHAVDAIAIEVERISEGQRFVTKILAERPQSTPTARAESAGEALGEGRPILALGAGPIEPIRAAERQMARQMNTPH
jgi:hypothetical protein